MFPLFDVQVRGGRGFRGVDASIIAMKVFLFLIDLLTVVRYCIRVLYVVLRRIVQEHQLFVSA